MLENIINLEETVGEADTAEEFLRNAIFNKKLQFYEKFSDLVREKLENR